jgi:hypothetical protein
MKSIEHKTILILAAVAGISIVGLFYAKYLRAEPQDTVKVKGRWIYIEGPDSSACPCCKKDSLI